jgi:aryl-alcohol dehydrogenase-like predicted oxidoreductase
MSISRRRFLEHSAAAGTLAARAAGAAPAIPRRPLGSTGERVSILALGCGSRFFGMPEEESLESARLAFAQGINYFDTAESYGKQHESQLRLGKFFQARGGKKGIFLASKISGRDYDTFMRMVDESLKRLHVDQFDLLHIHALMGPDDLAKVSAKGGAYEALAKAKERKLTRFIGVTCHAYPEVLKTALERHEFDSTQMALNAAQRAQVKDSPPCFETVALPVALRKKMGVTAMKIFAQEAILGQAPVEKLVYYSMSLPVAAAVIGHPKLANLEENIRLAKSFKPLPPEEMKRLSGELAPKNKLALDTFFRHHTDA